MAGGKARGSEAGREELHSRAEEKQQEFDLGVTGRGAVPWEQGSSALLSLSSHFPKTGSKQAKFLLKSQPRSPSSATCCTVILGYFHNLSEPQGPHL